MHKEEVRAGTSNNYSLGGGLILRANQLRMRIRVVQQGSSNRWIGLGFRN